MVWFRRHVPVDVSWTVLTPNDVYVTSSQSSPSNIVASTERFVFILRARINGAHCRGHVRIDRMKFLYRVVVVFDFGLVSDSSGSVDE